MVAVGACSISLGPLDSTRPGFGRGIVVQAILAPLSCRTAIKRGGRPSTYWYELYYYEDIQIIDYVFYWAGFLAWSTRIVAWSRARWQPVLS